VCERDAERLVNAVIICLYSDTVAGPQPHVVAMVLYWDIA